MPQQLHPGETAETDEDDDMTRFSAIIDDDFTAFTTSCFSQARHNGLQTIEDCPSDWAIGSDEAGDPIFCNVVIADFLQQDCF